MASYEKSTAQLLYVDCDAQWVMFVLCEQHGIFEVWPFPCCVSYVLELFSLSLIFFFFVFVDTHNCRAGYSYHIVWSVVCTPTYSAQ